MSGVRVTTLGCLVVAAVVSWPAHAAAQDDDRADRLPAATSPWFARIGVLDAIYHPHATIATSG